MFSVHMQSTHTQLPVGAAVRALTMHTDDRGGFTEVFRREWPTGVDPIQWNIVRSEPGVLRGVHVHVRHADYLLIVDGRATVGLRDLRTASPTFGLTTMLDLDASRLAAGAYVYRVEAQMGAETRVETGRMTVVR